MRSTARTLMIAAFAGTTLLRAQDSTAVARGAGRRIPDGAFAVTLDAPAIRASGARTLPELLAGRVAGLSVTWASGVPGVAPRIHLRGSTGTVGTPEPLLFVDGIRMRADPQFLGNLISTIPGRELLMAFTWDIPVDQIERVDVVFGAAGGAYLDFGAARGAVLVTTRRPSPEAPHVEATLEAVMPSSPTGIPDNYGTRSVEFNNPRCILAEQAAGNCTPTTREQWNPLGRSERLALSTGTRASVQGAGGLAGGAWRSGVSVERGPSLLVGDGLDRLALSAAFTRAIGTRFDLATDVRYRRAVGYYGPFTETLSGALFGRSADDSLGGFFPASGAPLEHLGVAHRVDQLVFGAQLRMALTERLRATARVGVDKGQRFSQRIRPPAGPYEGSRISLSARDAGRSVSADLAYDHTLRRGVSGSAFVAATLLSGWPAERRDSISTSGPPTATTSTAIGELDQFSITAGERIHLGPGRSIGLGARSERFGRANFALQSDLLPSVDVSWAIRDRSPDERGRLVSGIQLRAAHGKSVETPSAGIFGQAKLQRLSETEVGIGVRILRAATLDVTAFRRRVTDAIYLAFTGPGTGAFQGARWTVDGADLALALAPIPVGPFAWHTTLATSFLDYGRVDGTGMSFVLAGGWMAPNSSPIGTIATWDYTYDDADADGIIARSEVTMGNGPVDAGNTQPRRILGLNTSFTLGHRLAFGAQLDGKGGHVALDFTEAWRCNAGLCRALHDPNTSLADQARAVVARYSLGSSPLSAFIEDASFVRLRELWLRFRLGTRADSFASATELRISARNVATWTDYSGLDPEVGSLFGAGLRIGEDRSWPLMRSVSVELRMAW